MAKITLSEDFNTLGGPWQAAHAWSLNGYVTEGSWLPNPALLPADSNPFSIANGVLTLTDSPSHAPAAETGGLSRIGAQIFTENVFQQTYGYFEASIQMPSGNGVGGAFWLMPIGVWPPEIDIAEVLGNQPNVLVNTLHTVNDIVSRWGPVADTSQGFHTYAIDWTPNKITWYFDRQPVFEATTPAEFNQPMYPIFSVNSGTPASWGGAPDPSLVAQMKIDYLRVYDSNPYVDSATISAVLQGTPTPDIFVIDQPNTVVQNFSVNDMLDFKVTAQDFPKIAITPAAGATSIDYNGKHVGLPGLMPDQLSPANFVILPS